MGNSILLLDIGFCNRLLIKHFPVIDLLPIPILYVECKNKHLIQTENQ